MIKPAILTMFLATIVCVAAVGPALSQDRPSGSSAPVIAIVDIEGILRQSSAVTAVRAELDKIVDDIQKEIADEEQKLRARDQELQQQRMLLDPEVYSRQRQELQTNANELQQRARGMRQSIDNGYNETMYRIQEVLFEEVGKIADERGITLVLPRSQIVVAIDSYDISPVALDRLNARLPRVELNLEWTDLQGR